MSTKQAMEESFREELKIDVADVKNGCATINEGGVNIFSREVRDRACHLSITNTGHKDIRHAVFARSSQSHKHVLLTKFGYRFSVGIQSGGTAVIHGILRVSKDTIERTGDIDIQTYWSMFVPTYFVSGDILDHENCDADQLSLDPFSTRETCEILDMIERSEGVIMQEINRLREEIRELRSLIKPPSIQSGNPFE